MLLNAATIISSFFFFFYRDKMQTSSRIPMPGQIQWWGVRSTFSFCAGSLNAQLGVLMGGKLFHQEVLASPLEKEDLTRLSSYGLISNFVGGPASVHPAGLQSGRVHLTLGTARARLAHKTQTTLQSSPSSCQAWLFPMACSHVT